MTEPRTEAFEVIDRLVGADARRVPGWATVELDRAARDLGGGTAGQVRDVPDDPLLGARCRVLAAEKGDAILLLEPATEGRIAASLARYGEGYVVTWIRLAPDRYDNLVASARREGLRLSSEAAGPFGRERLVLGGPAWGPHLLVSEIGPTGSAPGAATIER